MDLAQTIEKVLSANDTGETGGHQAGILVPKDPKILAFFPELDKSIKNPRAVLDLHDDTGCEWVFRFIYYNNSRFGGTRDEFRLTGMTAFFREFNLKAGDVIVLHRVQPMGLRITYRRSESPAKVLKLGTTWKVIQTAF